MKETDMTKAIPEENKAPFHCQREIGFTAQ
jgi:hypothetical protein